MRGTNQDNHLPIAALALVLSRQSYRSPRPQTSEYTR
jgi:hypothetical protein